MDKKEIRILLKLKIEKKTRNFFFEISGTLKIRRNLTFLWYSWFAGSKKAGLPSLNLTR